MANFEESYKIARGHEGGYSNNPDDRGGETYCGIARKRFPDWQGWKIVDQYKSAGNLGALPHDEALQDIIYGFYKNNFWDTLRLDEIEHQGVANELFDTGVNMGISVAASFLQKALNVLNRNGKDYGDLPITSTVGPLTVKTMNKHSRPSDVLKVLNCLQGGRYIDICLRDPTQEKFMRGWLTRVTL